MAYEFPKTGAEIEAIHDKVDGIEASADVTDTANVTSAGALMDSEVDVDIKTLVLPASTTISAAGADLIDDADASAQRTTMGVAIGADVQAHAVVLDNTTASYTSAEETKLAGIETGANIAFKALAVVDLSDAATPSVLTTTESTNKCISNYKSSGADHVFTMPAAHILGNIIFIIGDEFQVDIEPDTGDNFFLNGTAMAANEHIQNTADTLGEQIVGYCANINGTLTWMFTSSDAAWVEETP